MSRLLVAPALLVAFLLPTALVAAAGFGPPEMACCKKSLHACCKKKHAARQAPGFNSASPCKASCSALPSFGSTQLAGLQSSNGSMWHEFAARRTVAVRSAAPAMRAADFDLFQRPPPFSALSL
ncbi:MAG: hypothetical protein SGI92_33315 [Bryobacteraceae bacterium]|nr:hypothetical protein [Bryobacteraceae bacterium]